MNWRRRLRQFFCSHIGIETIMGIEQVGDVQIFYTRRRTCLDCDKDLT